MPVSRLIRLFRWRTGREIKSRTTINDSSSLHKSDGMNAIAEQEELVEREGLERYLARLIAAKAGVGVRPEDITEEYIRNARAKMVVPHGLESTYGGYDITGLSVLTPDEENAIEERVQKAARDLGLVATK